MDASTLPTFHFFKMGKLFAVGFFIRRGIWRFIVTTRETLLPYKCQRGLTVMEVLVAVLMLSIMGLGLVQSSLLTAHARAVNIRNSVATQIAEETLEKYVAVDPSTLTDVSEQTTTQNKDGINFTQKLSIASSADGSKLVTVEVQANPVIGAGATLTLRVMPWGAL